MALKLELELGDDDLAYYRGVMDATWERNQARNDQDLLRSARRLLQEQQKGKIPGYVRKRLDDLGALISMLEDPEWPLEDKDRRRILAATSYFADPVDMIPDKIPGLGFLDDAIMAELVIGELQHDLEGYREFCEYREKEQQLHGEEGEHVSREEWLAAKRRQIFLRIQRRQQERRRHWSTEGPTDPILRYEY